ncbi:uncharacterized protein (DUF2461 family) [Actinokineospora baliensis]|uniref:DUF2461 family protein n=1 Tax=Actinokineospora baliensis TaxID=547056 RepID=UPI00195BF7E3|nr:DUF2461 family protein [Actinokineospora baliensis]MBM7775389.1 uncharacterized protein (DUF2461 family) [Actinokineospora baliensis]
MPRRFTGWPVQALDVLHNLDGVPSTQVRERNRRDRERLVRAPMADLLADLADADPRYADFSVWHFAKDPFWWQHQGAVVRLARNVEIGLRFDLDGLHVKGAWHYPDPGQVRQFRSAVAEDGSGAELVGILAALPQHFEVTGDVMKRGPREYPPDHPRADLLRYRSLVATRPVRPEEAVHSAAAVDQVLQVARELDALLGWLARNVVIPAPRLTR